MSIHMTKTWFDGEKIVTQEIPEEKIHWQESLEFKIWCSAPAETEDKFAFVKAVMDKLKEKNT